MRWWKGALTLALVAGVSTLQAREGLRAPLKPEIRTAAKEKSSERGRRTILYRNGVIPWRGARILGFTPTQILETFDNGIDTTATGFWESIVDGNGDGVTWDTTTAWGSGNFVFPSAPGAAYDDDAAGNGAPAGTEAITTKAIDFTMYQPGDTVLLSFYSSFQIYGTGGGEYAALAVQPNIFGVWGNWDTVWVQTGADREALEIVDLSAYAQADSIKLSFAFVDTSAEWGWGWGIDDIAFGTLTQQIFLAEDFEGCALPAGWTTQDGNGDGTTWTVGTTGDLSIYEPPNFGTCYAFYSDDDAGSGQPAGEEWLISPAVYVGGFTGTLGLSYDFGFRIIDQVNESTVVYIRTHDGTAWGNWTEIVAYAGADTSLSEDLDISTFLPAESIQVAFVYKDLDGGWYWAVGVDNVMLYEINLPIKDAGVVSLDPGAVGVAPPTFTPTVVVKNFGLTQQSYQAHLTIEDTQGNVLFHGITPLDYRNSGQVDTVVYAAFTANLGDTLILTAWTDLADDNPNNDMLSYTVVVVNANDAAVAITGPAYGDPLLPATFDVTVSNVGALDLASVDVQVDVVDQATNSVVFSEVLTVGPIPAQTQTVVSTSPFYPPAENTDYTVVAYLVAPDDDSANDTAQTAFTTQIAPMGTVLAAFSFPGLPSTYDLAGITYREDNQRFYVVSMGTPGVYEFDPTTGSLTLLFNTSNFGAAVDVPWGIAYDPTDTTLWLTQLGFDNLGNLVYHYAAKYDFTGTLLDTVDLVTLTGMGYIAGMDYFPRTQEPGGQLVGGYFWAVGVADASGNSMPSIWKLDLNNKSVVAQVANPDPSTYRGLAYYARGVNLVFLGGWNQGAVQVWDSTLSTQMASWSFADVADFDLWEDITHYQALIVQTHTDLDNTIRVVALGMPWAVDVNETPAPAVISFAPRGISRGMAVATLALPAAADVKAEVFDATGRRMARVFEGKLSAGVHELRFNAPRAGLYFWKVRAGDRTFQAKTVVVK